MDLLRELFEQHFHSLPDRVLPLQGELGGSGRKIVGWQTKSPAPSVFSMSARRKSRIPVFFQTFP